MAGSTGRVGFAIVVIEAVRSISSDHDEFQQSTAPQSTGWVPVEEVVVGCEKRIVQRWKEKESNQSCRRLLCSAINRLASATDKPNDSVKREALLIDQVVVVLDSWWF